MTTPYLSDLNISHNTAMPLPSQAMNDVSYGTSNASTHGESKKTNVVHLSHIKEYADGSGEVKTIDGRKASVSARIIQFYKEKLQCGLDPVLLEYNQAANDTHAHVPHLLGDYQAAANDEAFVQPDRKETVNLVKDEDLSLAA